jgi:F-type H+-transporting ATPase subunit delta
MTMIPETMKIAKKYAQAFWDLAYASYDEHDFKKTLLLHEFLKSHRDVLFFFSVPLVPGEVIDKGCDYLFKDFATASLLHRLMRLLIEHKRSFLLPGVLLYIAEQYKHDCGMISFSIISSHAIDKEAEQKIVRFIKRHVNKHIIYALSIDPELIAGLRLQSNSLLWEYSLRKQLRALKRELPH